MPRSDTPALADLIAHSENEQSQTQSLEEHLRGVAERAAGFAEAFDSQEFARWLGWWHDAGKVHKDFQAYIKAPDEQPRGPDHSSVGMLEAAVRMEPLAFNVAGHHGGLPDYSYLKDRIARKQQEERITEGQAAAAVLLGTVVPVLSEQDLPAFLQAHSEKETRLRITFWLRMLHSALVDADCLDTEAHFDAEKAQTRAADAPTLDALWARFEADQHELVDCAPDTEVNRARAQIYDACLDAATLPPGLFSLSVPTGGGKTRSAMAFGLRHALEHGHRRVIVALPYTSIIEQNAAVYQDIFGRGAVLEHHSAVRAEAKTGDESEAERWRRLAAENWDAPVVVTTTVQLLESLFASHNGRCRKLHRIAGSVLILDEVQTLPPDLLEPTLYALRHLVEAYGVTLVLCTATQPALAARDGFDGLSGVREIVPEPERFYRRLQRVEYEIASSPWSWQQVAGELQAVPQALVVLNTIKDAMAVLNALDDAEHVFHLSTQLCGAHRRRVLDEVRRCLAAGDPVRLVSTQVVEAGVDIDFPLVLRAHGPLDRIIQAAGRCNREGKREAGRVVVFEPEDGAMPPGAYTRGTDVTTAMLREDPGLDWHDPATARRYFQRFYDVSNLDERGVQALCRQLRFKEVGRTYRLINEETFPVVVPYEGSEGDGKWKAVLRRVEAKGHASRADFRALQPYVVNLRAWVHEQAVQEGLCNEVVPGLWSWEGGYDSELRGLRYTGPQPRDLVV